MSDVRPTIAGETAIFPYQSVYAGRRCATPLDAMDLFYGALRNTAELFASVHGPAAVWRGHKLASASEVRLRIEVLMADIADEMVAYKADERTAS